MFHRLRHSAPQLWLAATALLAPGALLAQALEPALAPSGGAAFLRLAVGLAIVVGLIYACAWVARRAGVGKHGSNGVPMKIVGSLALGPRERIVTLEVEGTWLVVGVTPGGMHTLHTLPARPLPAPPRAGFMNSFEQALQQRGLRTMTPPRSTDPAPPRPPSS